MIPLSEKQRAALCDTDTEFPSEYVQLLLNRGWGELNTGWMIYSGPVAPDGVVPKSDADTMTDVVFIADDMTGYLIGFQKTGDGWRLIGVDSTSMKVVPEEGSLEEILGL